MAGIADNYEINIAKDGFHFCKIELPETFEEKAVEKLNVIRNLFGPEYHITMTHWVCRGEHKEEWS